MNSIRSHSRACWNRCDDPMFGILRWVRKVTRKVERKVAMLRLSSRKVNPLLVMVFHSIHRVGWVLAWLPDKLGDRAVGTTEQRADGLSRRGG